MREKGNVDDRKERGGAERDERERKTFARFINFTGTRQLFKLHRADRPRLSLISPIYLLPCLAGLSPRNPLRDRRDGTRDLPEKKRNDSIATIKFLGAPFSDRMTMVVRAITVVKNFPERLVIERTGFLAQYIHIRRGKPFVRFEPSFLPTLCNVPSLCRDKRNETCVKFVDRSERRSSFNSIKDDPRLIYLRYALASNREFLIRVYYYYDICLFINDGRGDDFRATNEKIYDESVKSGANPLRGWIRFRDTRSPHLCTSSVHPRTPVSFLSYLYGIVKRNGSRKFNEFRNSYISFYYVVREER